MFDILSVIFVVISVITLIFMYLFTTDLISKLKKQQSIDPKIANDLVGEEPYCPECQCGDLELIDLTDGVPWLKGHVEETDYFRCNHCGAVFSDENWKVK